MENKTIAILFAAILYAVPLHAEVAASINQASRGNQSPVINSKGDATVNYGLDEEKLKAMLEEQEEKAIKKLQTVKGDEQKRRELELTLQNVQEKLSNFQTSYVEELFNHPAISKDVVVKNTAIAFSKTPNLSPDELKSALNIYSAPPLFELSYFSDFHYISGTIYSHEQSEKTRNDQDQFYRIGHRTAEV